MLLLTLQQPEIFISPSDRRETTQFPSNRREEDSISIWSERRNYTISIWPERGATLFPSDQRDYTISIWLERETTQFPSDRREGRLNFHLTGEKEDSISIWPERHYTISISLERGATQFQIIFHSAPRPQPIRLLTLSKEENFQSNRKQSKQCQDGYVCPGLVS